MLKRIAKRFTKGRLRLNRGFSKIDLDQNDQPKWMKFFTYQETSNFDVDRSLATFDESPDLSRRMIISSYKKFNLDQLLKCFGYVNHSDKDKIVRETLDRIFEEEFNVTKEVLLKFISTNKYIFEPVDVVMKAITLKLYEYWPGMTLNEKFIAFEYFFESNKIDLEIFEDFVETILSPENKETIRKMHEDIQVFRYTWIIGVVTEFYRGERLEELQALTKEMNKAVLSVMKEEILMDQIIYTHGILYRDYLSRFYLGLNPMDKNTYRENICHLCEYMGNPDFCEANLMPVKTLQIILHINAIMGEKDHDQMRKSAFTFFKLSNIHLERTINRQSFLTVQTKLKLFDWNLIRGILFQDYLLTYISKPPKSSGLRVNIVKTYTFLCETNVNQMEKDLVQFTPPIKKVWKNLTSCIANLISQKSTFKHFISKNFDEIESIFENVSYETDNNLLKMNIINYKHDELEFSKNMIEVSLSYHVNNNAAIGNHEMHDVADEIINQIDIGELIGEDDDFLLSTTNEFKISSRKNNSVAEIEAAFDQLDLKKFIQFDRFLSSYEFNGYKMIKYSYKALFFLLIYGDLNPNKPQVRQYFTYQGLTKFLRYMGCYDGVLVHLLRTYKFFPQTFADKNGGKSEQALILDKVVDHCNKMLEKMKQDKEAALNLIKENQKLTVEQSESPIEMRSPRGFLALISPKTKKEPLDNGILYQQRYTPFHQKYSLLDDEGNIIEKNLFDFVLKYTGLIKDLLLEPAMKAMIRRGLDETEFEYKEDVIDFPFITDFEVKLENKIVAINIITDSRKLIGAPNLVTADISIKNEYQKIKGRVPWNLDLSQINFTGGGFKTILLNEFKRMSKNDN